MQVYSGRAIEIATEYHPESSDKKSSWAAKKVISRGGNIRASERIKTIDAGGNLNFVSLVTQRQRDYDKYLTLAGKRNKPFIDKCAEYGMTVKSTSIENDMGGSDYTAYNINELLLMIEEVPDYDQVDSILKEEIEPGTVAPLLSHCKVLGIKSKQYLIDLARAVKYHGEERVREFLRLKKSSGDYKYSGCGALSRRIDKVQNNLHLFKLRKSIVRKFGTDSFTAKQLRRFLQKQRPHLFSGNSTDRGDTAAKESRLRSDDRLAVGVMLDGLIAYEKSPDKRDYRLLYQDDGRPAYPSIIEFDSTEMNELTGAYRDDVKINSTFGF